jgi:hypothetical protein
MSFGPVTRAAAQLAAKSKEDLPNLLSLAVFFVVTALLFRSAQFALLVTASLGFHELGHAAMLSRLGLDFRVGFGLVGAWTWSRSAERARLTHFDNAAIHLAGPLLSLVLALVALGLDRLWQPGGQHLLVLANFSAQVGFMNLLPLGPLTDGGKIVRRMVQSLPDDRRRRVVFLPFLLTALMLVFYLLVSFPGGRAAAQAPVFLGLLLVGVWLSASMFYEARRAGPRLALPTQAMTSRQVYLMTLFVWDLLLLSLVVISATPFWLAPEYVIGSLRNFAALLGLVSRLAG